LNASITIREFLGLSSGFMVCEAPSETCYTDDKRCAEILRALDEK